MSQNIIVRKSKIDKKGVFAARDFKKGEIVLEWNPKILANAEVKLLKAGQKHYLLPAGKKGYLLMRSPEKFMNHSCEANTRARNRCDIAVRNIRKGEEITSDYGKEGGAVPFACKCRSKKCRGTIE